MGLVISLALSGKTPSSDPWRRPRLPRFHWPWRGKRHCRRPGEILGSSDFIGPGGGIATLGAPLAIWAHQGDAPDSRDFTGPAEGNAIFGTLGAPWVPSSPLWRRPALCRFHWPWRGKRHLRPLGDTLGREISLALVRKTQSSAPRRHPGSRDFTGPGGENANFGPSETPSAPEISLALARKTPLSLPRRDPRFFRLQKGKQGGIIASGPVKHVVLATRAAASSILSSNSDEDSSFSPGSGDPRR